MRRALELSLLAALGVAACATGAVDPRVVVPVDAGAPRDVASQQDAGATDAGSVDDVPAAPDDTGPAPDAGLRCVPNHDGVIQRSEIAFLVGATVLYSVNDPGVNVSPVDTEGVVVDGTRRWDYSAARTADHRVLDEVIAPTGQWWSSLYASATYAAVIDRSSDTLGVFRASATELSLLGTVSREANRTNLAMNPPVTVLRFPLQVGDTWTQQVTGLGTYNYTPLSNVSTYTTHVDAVGEVWTPAGRFPALRVRTDLDQSVPLTLLRVTRRTVTFVSECWGVVAKLTSVDNESAAAFTTAAEYRRLGL